MCRTRSSGSQDGRGLTDAKAILGPWWRWDQNDEDRLRKLEDLR
jgi:hypothetical protein